MPNKKKVIRKEIASFIGFNKPERSASKGTSKGTRKRIILKTFGWEVLLFSLTFTLGLFTAVEIQKVLKEQKIVLPAISFGDFVFYFLFVTLIILLITYLPRRKRLKRGIYKFLFVFTTIYGALAVLSLLLPDSLALLIIGTLLYFWFKRPMIAVHNLLMLLGMAGIGAMLGLSLDPRVVILFLAVFSIYDFVAVYKTKHMLKMARSMLETGVVMGLVLPQGASGFLQDVRRVKPGENFIILGGGDIIFPLLFSVSMLSRGIPDALIVAFFSLLGLAVSFAFFILPKKREPIPALPPIALFSIIGYIITLFI